MKDGTVVEWKRVSLETNHEYNSKEFAESVRDCILGCIEGHAAEKQVFAVYERMFEQTFNFRFPLLLLMMMNIHFSLFIWLLYVFSVCASPITKDDSKLLAAIRGKSDDQLVIAILDELG